MDAPRYAAVSSPEPKVIPMPRFSPKMEKKTVFQLRMVQPLPANTLSLCDLEKRMLQS